MRYGSLALVLLVAASLAHAQDVPSFTVEAPTAAAPQATPGVVLAEMQALNRRMEAIEESLEDLSGFIARDRGYDRGPNLKKLRALTLPEDADRAALEAYVSEIAVITQGQQRHDADDDPQVAMLADVGRRDLGVLVDSIGLSNHMDRYVLAAIKLVATDGQKDTILDHLARRPELIDIVTARGWVAEARGVIVEEIRNGRAAGNARWINALSGLRDAEATGLLVEAFVRGPNRVNTFRVLENREGVDLADAVAEAWDAAKTDNQNERMQLAPIAVRYGHSDALAILIDALPVNQPNQHGHFFGPHGDVRSNVLIHIDFYGSNEAIRDWYRDNRDRLRFDSEKRRFTARPALGATPTTPALGTDAS